MQGSPWDGKLKTVSGGEGEKGREVWWEEKDGKRIVMPDGVEVESVASRVANGEVVSLLPLQIQRTFANNRDSGY